MGNLLSRVRKKKSTIETLEKLDNDIKEFEENRMNAQRTYKKLTKLLLVYSLGLYVICGIIFYFQFTSSLKEKLLYLVPIAVSPLILYVVKTIISWYYIRLINKNQIRLNEMKKEKKRILEEVMDKETYKVAKEILEKFSASEFASKTSSNLIPITKSDAGTRKRTVTGPAGFPSASFQSQSNILRGGNQTLRPVLPSLPPIEPLSAPVPSMMQLPAPILPVKRNYVDKIVEYLIGDGVNNRYALICSNCHSHNGMALKEEFEYINYKCCYCFFYNPARKIRPEAPKLESSLRLRRVSDTDSEKTSGENSDVEHKIPLDKTSDVKISSLNNDEDLNNLESDAANNIDVATEEEISIATEEREIHSDVEQNETEEISSSQPESNATCDKSLVNS